METNLSFFKAEIFQVELQQLLIILCTVSGLQSSTYYNTTLCSDTNFESKIWITQGSKYVYITEFICMTYWSNYQYSSTNSTSQYISTAGPTVHHNISVQ
jgi:hypothetical protein